MTFHLLLRYISTFKIVILSIDLRLKVNLYPVDKPIPII